MASKSRKKQALHPGAAARLGAHPHPPAPATATTEAAGTRRGLWLAAAGGILFVIAFLALIFLLPGWLGGASPAPTPEPANPQGRISFVRRSADGTQRDLYVVDPDGRRQEQLTKGIVIEGATSWSPDGRRLIAQATIENVLRIIRIAVDSDNKATESVQLTADVKGDSALPAWSPDGTMIAYQSKGSGDNYQAYVMDANGNGKRMLSDGKGYAGQPAWSPDGKSIVYAQGDKPDVGTAKELYVVDLAGGAPRKITSLGKDIGKPNFSNDGKSIIFQQNESDRLSTISVINLDGTGLRTLSDAARSSTIELSPSGTDLAYYYVSQEPPTGSNVYTVPLAGATPTVVSSGTADSYMPVWSPDGKRLAWAAIPVGTEGHKIVVANPDGSNVQVVSSGPGDDYQPTWGVAAK